MEQEKKFNKSRIEDPAFIEKIRNQFADEWEEIITGKGLFDEIDYLCLEKIRAGEKVPRNHRWLHDKLVRIGQDHRLSLEEIDRLREIFLE